MKKIIVIVLLFFTFGLLSGCMDFTKNLEILDGDGEISVVEITDIISTNSYVLKIDDVRTENESIDVKLVSGEVSKLSLRTDKNILDTIDIKIEDNNIIITGDAFRYHPTEIVLELTEVKIEKMDVKGVINFIPTNDLMTENFTLNADGVITGSLDFQGVTGNIEITNAGVFTLSFTNINCESIKLDISGTCTYTLTGNTNNFHYNGDGVLGLNAKTLVSDNVYLVIDGVINDFKVNAVTLLDIDADCVGSIKYLGNPNVNPRIKGVCTFEKITE